MFHNFQTQMGIIKKGHKFGSKLVNFTKVNKFKFAGFRNYTSLGINLCGFENPASLNLSTFVKFTSLDTNL